MLACKLNSHFAFLLFNLEAIIYKINRFYSEEEFRKTKIKKWIENNEHLDDGLLKLIQFFDENINKGRGMRVLEEAGVKVGKFGLNKMLVKIDEYVTERVTKCNKSKDFGTLIDIFKLLDGTATEQPIKASDSSSSAIPYNCDKSFSDLVDLADLAGQTCDYCDFG